MERRGVYIGWAMWEKIRETNGFPRLAPWNSKPELDFLNETVETHFPAHITHLHTVTSKHILESPKKYLNNFWDK